MRKENAGIRVAPSGNKWVVLNGAGGDASCFWVQDDAIEFARQLARKRKTELIIQFKA